MKNDATTKGYRIALRPDEDGMLDDVVVSDVSLFRMERMGTDEWWLSCHLNGVDEPLVWWIKRDGKQVIAVTTASPSEDVVVYEHNLKASRP